MSESTSASSVLKDLVNRPISPFTQRRVDIFEISKTYHRPGEVFLPGDIVKVLSLSTGPGSQLVVVDEVCKDGDAILGHLVEGYASIGTQCKIVICEPAMLQWTASLRLMKALHKLCIGDLYQEMRMGELFYFLGLDEAGKFADCLDRKTQSVKSVDVNALRYIGEADSTVRDACTNVYRTFLEKRTVTAAPKNESAEAKPFDYVRISTVPPLYGKNLVQGCFYRVEKPQSNGSLLINGENGSSILLGQPNVHVSDNWPLYSGYYVPPTNEGEVNPYKAFHQVYILTASESLGVKAGSIHDVLYWNGPRPVICPQPYMLVGLSNRANELDSQMPELPTWYALGSEDLLKKFVGNIPPGVIREILITKSAPRCPGVTGNKYPVVRWRGKRPTFRVVSAERQGSDRLMIEDSFYGAAVALWAPVLPSESKSADTPVESEPTPKITDFVCGDVVKFTKPGEKCPRLAGIILRPSIIYPNEYVVLDTGSSSPYVIPKNEIVFVRKPNTVDWTLFHTLVGIKVGMDIEYQGKFFRVFALNGNVCEVYPHTGETVLTKILLGHSDMYVVTKEKLKEKKWVRITGPVGAPNITIGREYCVLYQGVTGPVIFNDHNKPYILAKNPDIPGSTCFPGYTYI